MADHHSTIAAEGLTVQGNAPFELLVQGRLILGRTSSDDVAPPLVLAGALAGRMAELTYNGQTRPLAAEQGHVTLSLPPGKVAFAVKLR